MMCVDILLMETLFCSAGKAVGDPAGTGHGPRTCAKTGGRAADTPGLLQVSEKWLFYLTKMCFYSSWFLGHLTYLNSMLQLLISAGINDLWPIFWPCTFWWIISNSISHLGLSCHAVNNAQCCFITWGRARWREHWEQPFRRLALQMVGGFHPHLHADVITVWSELETRPTWPVPSSFNWPSGWTNDLQAELMTFRLWRMFVVVSQWWVSTILDRGLSISHATSGRKRLGPKRAAMTAW